MDTIGLIAFDVDGTVAQGNTWQKVHAVAGVTPEEDNEWFGKYYRQEVSFEEWAAFINNRYKICGKTRRDFEKAMDGIQLIHGAKETVSALAKKYPVCLISSGLDYYVGKVALQLSVSTWYANYSLVYDANAVVQRVAYQEHEEHHKVSILKKLCAERGLQPAEIVYVGDASNDIPAFVFTKRGIMVGEGNEKLKAVAWQQVAHITEVAAIVWNSFI